MYKDPIVEEVRKIREHLALEHDFNVASIFQDLRKRQASLGKKLVRRQKKNLLNKSLHLTAIPLRSIPAGELHVIFPLKNILHFCFT